MIIRFIFPFSISKEILFSRFNCAFFSSNFPFLAFFSKSRRSSLRFLLLRSLPAPDKIASSGGGHDDHDDDGDNEDDDDDDDDGGGADDDYVFMLIVVILMKMMKVMVS